MTEFKVVRVYFLINVNNIKFNYTQNVAQGFKLYKLETFKKDGW